MIFLPQFCGWKITSHFDTESISHPRGKSSQDNEFTDFGHENTIPRHDRFLESIETFTNENTLRFSQEMNSMTSMMHSQMNREINSAIAETVIPEIQNLVSSLSSGNRDI